MLARPGYSTRAIHSLLINLVSETGAHSEPPLSFYFAPAQEHLVPSHLSTSDYDFSCLRRLRHVLCHRINF
jgi:hypothetical protein